MPDNENRQKVTVETLLRLKRCERPSPEFWDDFNKDFDRRRLHELVKRPSIYDLLVAPAIRVLALGMPVAAVFMITFLWKPVEKSVPGPLFIGEDVSDVAAVTIEMQPVAEVMDEAQLELASVDTQQMSNQFVLDALQEQSHHAGLRFRKVLYTPAIRLSVPSGAFYVRDSMSSDSYQVTTADAKLGRNF